MLTEIQAQEIITKYIELRKNSEENPTKLNIKEFKQYENYCIEQFRYIVDIDSAKYRQFQNHPDIFSEGLLGLVYALKTYNPKKGIFFYWAHKYVNTRVARQANQHTTIRYPLKYSKENQPQREKVIPDVYEEYYLPEDMYESKAVGKAIVNALEFCTETEKVILKSYYGIGEMAQNIDAICKEKQMCRPKVIKNLNSGINKIKEKILL